MITCPWCGTNYETFQSNCNNCGGPLPHPVPHPTPATDQSPAPPPVETLEPPPPPRSFRSSYLWRQVMTDAGAIVGAVFAFIGILFGCIGVAMIISLVGAVIGVVFAGLGGIFALIGIPLVVWRYNEAQQTLNVLRIGQATLGEVTDVYENLNVEVNGRHPWTIAYRFEVEGWTHDGKTRTLRTPGLTHQPGQPVHVLYLPSNPDRNTIYPPVM